MSRILILHETDAETAKIARRVAERCRGAGHEVLLRDADALAAPLQERYDGVVVGCSLRRGQPSESLRQVVARHRDAWHRLPSACFSVVSGHSADTGEPAKRLTAKITRATGWVPALAAAFPAGRVDPTQITRFTDSLLHAIQAIHRAPARPARAGRLLATGAVLGTALAAYAYKQHMQSIHGAGATSAEQQSSYPGDDLVPNARTRATWAIDIQAPPADVWPWLIQMGYRRGGWYAHDLVDNGAHRSAPRVLAEHQMLHEGDTIPVDARADAGLRVAKMRQDRHLVLTWTPTCRPGTTAATHALWAFHLVPNGVHGTRLIVRILGNGQHPWAEAAGTLLARQVGPLMQRKQLQGIKMRAERLYRIHRSRARRYRESLTPP